MSKEERKIERKRKEGMKEERKKGKAGGNKSCVFYGNRVMEVGEERPKEPH